jgi:hypothetical protein
MKRALHFTRLLRAVLLGSLGDDAGETMRLIAPGAGVGYSESPTVTFSPLHSEEFTLRLVEPIELESLYLLTHYGWSLERSLRLLVEINGISNALPRETTAQNGESNSNSLSSRATCSRCTRGAQNVPVLTLPVAR